MNLIQKWNPRLKLKLEEETGWVNFSRRPVSLRAFKSTARTVRLFPNG